MPMIAITIISSISVNPLAFICPPLDDGTELEDRHVEPDHEDADEDGGDEVRRDHQAVERRSFPPCVGGGGSGEERAPRRRIARLLEPANDLGETRLEPARLIHRLRESQPPL